MPRIYFTIDTLTFSQSDTTNVKNISIFSVFIYTCKYVGWKTDVFAYQWANGLRADKWHNSKRSEMAVKKQNK
jgi:hypothetical protein